MVKTRSYIYTFNNYTANQLTYLKNYKNCIYHVFQEEIGSAPNYTRHLQGFIYFKNAITFGGCKKRLGSNSIHVEGRKGTVQEASDYCSDPEKRCQGGILHVYGEMPMSQTEKGKCSKAIYLDVIEHAKAGDCDWIALNYPGIYFRGIFKLNYLSKQFAPRPSDLKTLETDTSPNLWVYGDSGEGKSTYVRQLAGTDYFAKNKNKWFDCYQGEKTVIIDDFDLGHSGLGSHVKLWGDKFSFVGEIKGGAAYIRPRRMMITSNYSIDEIWKGDDQMIASIKRRYKVIKFDRSMRIHGAFVPNIEADMTAAIIEAVGEVIEIEADIVEPVTPIVELPNPFPRFNAREIVRNMAEDVVESFREQGLEESL